MCAKLNETSFRVTVFLHVSHSRSAMADTAAAVIADIPLEVDANTTNGCAASARFSIVNLSLPSDKCHSNDTAARTWPRMGIRFHCSRFV